MVGPHNNRVANKIMKDLKVVLGHYGIEYKNPTGKHEPYFDTADLDMYLDGNSLMVRYLDNFIPIAPPEFVLREIDFQIGKADHCIYSFNFNQFEFNPVTRTTRLAKALGGIQRRLQKKGYEINVECLGELVKEILSNYPKSIWDMDEEDGSGE